MEQEELLRIVERIAAGEHSEVDVDLLQEALYSEDKRSLLQLGKYNINIGQGGKEVHIGDRTYVQIDEESIRAIAVAIHDRMVTATFTSSFMKRIVRLKGPIKERSPYVKVFSFLIASTIISILLLFPLNSRELNNHSVFNANYAKCVGLSETASYKAVTVCQNVYETCKSTPDISSECGEIIETMPLLLESIRKLNLL